MQQKVSVITVCYNSEKTIAKCINSVYEQTWPRIEHIIIDGASTDKTLEIINSNPNRVTKIISEPDSGIYDAINKGIKLATGDIVGILNSDDHYYSNQVLELIVKTFKNKNVDCTYGNLIFSNSKGKTVRTWLSKTYKPNSFSKSWTPAHPTFYCKRELYKKYGLYKTDYKIAADVELMLRFLEIHKLKSFFIDEFLVNMRKGGVSNQGIKSTIIITKELKRAFKENGMQLNLLKYLFYKGLKLSQFLNHKNSK